MRTNVIYCDDNLKRMVSLPDESVDLIYLDPPFFSNRHYEVIWGDEGEVRSFEDRWEGGVEVYTVWMQERAIEMHRILKDTGSIYLHCDSHAGHYLKVMMDSVFGYKNFRNEIIWYRNSGGIGRRTFSKRHDTLFFYSKTKEYFYDGKAIGDLREQDKGTFGGYFGKDKDGREYREVRKGGKIYKYYMDEPKNPEDVWEVPQIPERDKTERLGYPTQKPEALLDRVIKASSRENDVVFDPFCGCGTAIVVANRLNRKWIGVDISPTACNVMKKRLRESGVKDVTLIGMPATEDDLRKLAPFEFQNWVVIEGFNGKLNPRKTGDMGIDGLTFMTHDPIQVKQSDKVGRNVIDNFETAMQRIKKTKGYIVAFGFTKGAYEEVARCKREKNLEVGLVTVKELLKKKE